jgi:hypothetical protein
VEQLIETEQLVLELGHHGAGKKLGMKYHGVRARMRKLALLRGEAVGRQGVKLRDKSGLEGDRRVER